MYRDVNTVVLVAGTGNSVVEAMGIGVGVSVLLLFEGQQVVGSNTLESVWRAWLLDGLDDGSDGDLVFLY